MNIKAKRKAITLTPISLAQLKNAEGKKLVDTPYYHLLKLLAEACDMNAGQHNVYIVLGATKKQDSLTLSITADDDRDTLYDTSLVGLSEQAAGVATA